ncbi:hypothetical protein [Pseudomonas chlororaphis]|nr:hypothetical protein [Pseudomonas chlororaphis]QIT23028.1 hypothetical protein HCN09_15245 [Pseudomonas chlororaphis subsp. aurantiaca]WDH01114.1 hypothetical protein PUP57_16380 [Pseudomonas chlororaphis]WDH10040.1 hypothetical protein PUP64_30635 [Pseudomonas chlororaphis]
MAALARQRASPSVRECTPDAFAGTSVFDDFADFSPLLQAKNGEEKG